MLRTDGAFGRAEAVSAGARFEQRRWTGFERSYEAAWHPDLVIDIGKGGGELEILLAVRVAGTSANPAVAAPQGRRRLTYSFEVLRGAEDPCQAIDAWVPEVEAAARASGTGRGRWMHTVHCLRSRRKVSDQVSLRESLTTGLSWRRSDCSGVSWRYGQGPISAMAGTRQERGGPACQEIQA